MENRRWVKKPYVRQLGRQTVCHLLFTSEHDILLRNEKNPYSSLLVVEVVETGWSASRLRLGDCRRKYCLKCDIFIATVQDSDGGAV